MAILTEKNNKVTEIKDEKFSVDLISSYSLCLIISFQELIVTVYHDDENRYLMLDHYTFQDVYTSLQLTECLAQAFDQHHCLQAGFWKEIKVIISHPRFSLIPSSLFSKPLAEDFLSINTPFSSAHEDVTYYRHEKAEVVNVFSVDKTVKKWLFDQYPGKNIRFFHQTSAMIEAAINGITLSSQRALLLYAAQKSMSVVLVDNGKPEYVNVFNYSGPEDLAYFTMFIYKELNLNPETIPLFLYGNVSDKSVAFKYLYKYIRHLKFGKRPVDQVFCYQFDDIPDHHYFDIFNQHHLK